MPYNYLPGFDVHLKDGGLIITRPDFATGSLLIIGPIGATTETTVQDSTPKWINSQSAFEGSFGASSKDNPLFCAWKQASDAGCQDVRLIELIGADLDHKYANLNEVYTYLEDYKVDNIAVVGVYGDDLVSELVLRPVEPGTALVAEEDDYALTKAEDGLSYEGASEFAAQLAGFCKAVSSRVSQTLGFIALKPAVTPTLSAVKTYVNGLLAKTGEPLVATERVYSGLISLVAGPKVEFQGLRESYLDSGVAAYAAMVSILAAQSSPTNKVLPGAGRLEYNLSPAQLDELCGINIVTFRNKAGRVVITDAMTTAGQGSDYTRLTTSRIVNDAVESVRTVADPFIGEPNDLPQRNALNTAIESALKAMREAGAISAYRFAIESTPTEIISGRMRIILEIVPAFELRKITTTIALRPSL